MAKKSPLSSLRQSGSDGDTVNGAFTTTSLPPGQRPPEEPGVPMAPVESGPTLYQPSQHPLYPLVPDTRLYPNKSPFPGSYPSICRGKSVPCTVPKNKVSRTSRACDNCRQSKAKCDEEKPCKNCRDKKVNCVFGELQPNRLDKRMAEIAEMLPSLKEEIAGMNVDINRQFAEINLRLSKSERSRTPHIAPEEFVLLETLSHGSPPMKLETRSLSPSTPSTNTPTATPSETGEQSSSTAYCDKAEWHPCRIQDYVCEYKKIPLYVAIVPVSQLDNMVRRFINRLRKPRSQAGPPAGSKRKRSPSVYAAWDKPSSMDVDDALVLLILAVGKFYVNIRQNSTYPLNSGLPPRYGYAYFDLGKAIFKKCNLRGLVDCIRAQALIAGYLCELHDKEASFAYLGSATRLIQPLLVPYLRQTQLYGQLSTGDKDMCLLKVACLGLET
ncbi:hypothetical protein F5B18DRAFT_671913 [Nemania serpens]|nr:hypothetical protein F5B18DRAFT_671913 [Nemania serpens]